MTVVPAEPQLADFRTGHHWMSIHPIPFLRRRIFPESDISQLFPTLPKPKINIHLRGLFRPSL